MFELVCSFSQAAAAIVAPKAALTSSTVLPGDSQGGQMFQGDSSGIQLRKPASAMEDHAPDLKTAEKTGALRAGGAGYGTGAGIRAVQAGPELTPAPLSQEGKAKEAAWFKTEESSGRATWRNNEMYDMETDGEGSL